ncbi:hypothetical protein FSPOR_8849 [Fusarium sporotrichioides]|uniref:F-box domain-containing protein n=1 Tax=Fusarium sporotrichioides TaxID=5514 RepID=A0A395RTD4_FUSSP|nr:hypothetical protein FSPOR_8849 [Fusarium sporotrichioides]
MVALWKLGEGMQQCIADILFGSNQRPSTTKPRALARAPVHPTSTGTNLLDLPNELIYAIGVTAERRDTKALSATCRRLRANLASVVLSRVKLSISLSATSRGAYTFAPLGEHGDNLGLVKRSARPPSFAGELLSMSHVADIIKAMASLKSLSLDVRVLSTDEVRSLVQKLFSVPRIPPQCLEPGCKMDRRCLMKSLEEDTDPESFRFTAAPGFSAHLESLTIDQSMRIMRSKSRPESINHCRIGYIAEGFPRLKSLVYREPLGNGNPFFDPNFTVDDIPTDGTMLGTVLKEKLPTLQRFVCTILFVDTNDLVPNLSRLRPFVGLVTGDHPTLNEMVIIISNMRLVCWERGSNQISMKECDVPWLFGSMSRFDQSMRESNLLNAIPLDSDE